MAMTQVFLTAPAAPHHPSRSGPLGSVGRQKVVEHFSIHLSATKIVHISTSVTPAHTDGKMKILCSEYWIRVLAFLTELAIFQV
ncbi:hypothetical protein QTO34_002973, partial [Cnephaeus nilssonii]